MYFRPGAHQQAGLAFSPLKAIISPRPIGWISSRGRDGSVNLAPYSYFNAISEFPPMVIFSSAPGPGLPHKDSLRNVIEAKEFVVNIVSYSLREKMNITSKDYPREINEFEKAGIEVGQCKTVSVPHVKFAPASLECKLWKTLTLPEKPDGSSTTMIMGVVTGMNIDEGVIKNGKIDVTSYEPLARLGYYDYSQVKDTFSMRRPD